MGFISSCAYFIYKSKSKILLFSVLIFCGSIAPFVNIGTPAPGVVAERFAYFASFGFCLIFTIAIIPYLKSIKFKSVTQFLSKPLIYLLPLVIVCMVYIWNRNSNWYNKLVLFEHDIPYLEKSAKANSLLANEYFEMLRSPNQKYSNQVLIQKCLKHYNIAVANDSSFFSAYNNAGVIYYSYLNDIPSAKKYFMLAIRHRPLYFQAYENLGNCFKQEKNSSKAFEYYKKSIEINPKQYSAYLGTINMFFEEKQYDKCLKVIKIAYSNFPKNYDLTAQEANCYLMKHDTLTAIAKYEQAYSLNPNHNLAQFLSQKYKETKDSIKSEFYKNK
jgi:tetratricopeptide (TPR) repeat protein